MKLLTVNLCLEEGDVERRLQALEQLVRTKKPEFIALQGVSNDTLSYIKTGKWGARYPHVAQPPIKYETRTKPTVAILSTFPILKSKTIYYENTAAHRLAIIVYYVMHCKSNLQQYICVSSTLLDRGPEHSHLRENEINQLMHEMIEDEECFILGDLSLLHSVDGELVLSGGWQDAWITSGNTGGGYTMDSGKNSQIHTWTQSRPDRILFKSLRYKLDSIEVVGEEKFGGTHSPHFGVLSNFLHLDTILPDHPNSVLPCSFTRVSNKSH